ASASERVWSWNNVMGRVKKFYRRRRFQTARRYCCGEQPRTRSRDLERGAFGLSYKNKGQLFALDATTGKILWLGEPRSAANSAIVKAGRWLFFLNNDGQLVVATNTRERLDVHRRHSVADSATW